MAIPKVHRYVPWKGLAAIADAPSEVTRTAGAERLGRPHVDTLAGSRFPNMKELRFEAADGVWRVAFAFDPDRPAILLVAGDKSGVAQRRFYRALIAKADKRFAAHLAKRGGE